MNPKRVRFGLYWPKDWPIFLAIFLGGSTYNVMLIMLIVQINS